MNVSYRLNDTGVCDVDAVTHAVSVTEHVGYLAIIPIVCVAGILLNVLCIVIFAHAEAELASCVYLSVRSVADLITCVLVLPVGLSHCTICFPDSDVLAEFTRVFNLYIYIPVANMSSMTSILLTAAVTMERYVLVRRRRVSTKQYRDRQAMIVSICLTATSILLNVPYFFVDGFVEDNVLDFYADTPSTAYTWVRVCAAKFLTTIMVAVINTLLIIEVRKNSRRKKASVTQTAHEKRRQKRKGRVTSMLVTVSIGFLIAHIPECFAHPGLFKTLFGECSVHTNGYRIYRLLCNILEMSCYAGSFVIVWLWSETCRRVLQNVCTGCRMRCSCEKNLVQSEVSIVTRTHDTNTAQSRAVTKQLRAIMELF